MPWLSWRTSPRLCVEDVSLFVNPRHWLTWPCSVVFIAVYNKRVILLTKWVTLSTAPCICGLRYPVGNAHAAVCPALQYFSTLSHKRNDLKKKPLNIKCVHWFALQLFSETFLILRRIEQDKKCTLVFTQNARYSCQIVMKTLIFSIDFLKILKYQFFFKNPTSGSQVVPCGRTDGQTCVTKVIVAFRKYCDRAQKFYFLPTHCLCVILTVSRTRRDIFSAQH